MDHKVSKDMISSGMIPSGEKTQADLGRIQYGSAPSPSSLMDAYKSIYEHHQKDKDGNTIPHENDINEGKIPAGLQAYLDKKKGKKEDKKEVKEGYGAAIKAGLGLVKKIAASETGRSVARGAATQFGASAVGNAMSGKQKQQKPTGGTVSASADLFDIVKGQLLDEGLTEEEIRDIMLTLTPDEIMEELSDVVKRNDALNRERAMKAAQERKVPDKVREASKRQYTAGGPKDTGANKYTTQDKKTIIDYNKNKESM